MFGKGVRVDLRPTKLSTFHRITAIEGQAMYGSSQAPRPGLSAIDWTVPNFVGAQPALHLLRK